MLFRTQFAALAVTTFLSVFSWQATAQAIPTASKRGDVDAFFTYGRGTTDYGPSKNNVMTFGADYMFRQLGPVQPGVNVRYVYSSGPIVNQPFLGGGIDLRFRQRYYIRPFVAADLGVGTVKNNIFNFSDSGLSYILGGGADIPVTPKIAGRVAFDYQTIKISGGPVPDLTFNPYRFNFGVVYRIR